MNRREMRRRVWFFLVASVCVAQASCIPANEPLSDAQKSETDKDLIGTWVIEKDDHTRFMVIGRHELAPDEADKTLPRGLMSYRQFTLTKDGKLGPGAFVHEGRGSARATYCKQSYSLVLNGQTAARSGADGLIQYDLRLGLDFVEFSLFARPKRA
jgi:hypothetical protein